MYSSHRGLEWGGKCGGNLIFGKTQTKATWEDNQLIFVYERKQIKCTFKIMRQITFKTT